MSEYKNKIDALNKLYSIRETIENNLAELDAIIQVYFHEEYSISYQHWMPQIKTALRDNIKFLPRGTYSMDYVLRHIEDKLFHTPKESIHKYIK
jgi:hypothetical protein